MALTFEQARECVLREVTLATNIETTSLLAVDGRILAESITADRDYPPFPRSARDGFAVRSADLPGELLVIGEVRAGDNFPGIVRQGEAVEIMTGAPLPDGADTVVMVEHTTQKTFDAETHGAHHVIINRTTATGENFVPRGLEAQTGQLVLNAGHKIGYCEIALLASVGKTDIAVYRQPRVAIIPTGDEIVEPGVQPSPFEIRNSNAMSLAAQVRRAGGVPEILPIARDNFESTHAAIQKGLQSDMLLLSGGVSAGKYDIVEKVLAEFGAHFFFTRVLIQPGQPLVFGRASGKYFFGLPGNPASTMITFEVFARAAIEKLQGTAEPALPLLREKLTQPFRQKPGLTRFLPALLNENGITPGSPYGSGDVVALTKANAFLVTEPDRENWAAGDDIRVLLR